MRIINTGYPETRQVGLLFFMLLFLLSQKLDAQNYYRMYKQDRPVESYHAYKNVIKRYNADLDANHAVNSLDSLANNYLDQKDYVAFLFHKNDAANILLTKNRREEALKLLQEGIRVFGQNRDSLHLEYASSLILMGYTPNSGRERKELLQKQIDIMEAISYSGQAYVHALLNLGFDEFHRRDRSKGIELLYKARGIALKNEDVYSLAIIDNTFILRTAKKDVKESTIEVLIAKSEELKQYAKSSMAINNYFITYQLLICDLYLNEKADYDKAIHYANKAIAYCDSSYYDEKGYENMAYSKLAKAYALKEDSLSFFKYYKLCVDSINHIEHSSLDFINILKSFVALQYIPVEDIPYFYPPLDSIVKKGKIKDKVKALQLKAQFQNRMNAFEESNQSISAALKLSKDSATNNLMVHHDIEYLEQARLWNLRFKNSLENKNNNNEFAKSYLLLADSCYQLHANTYFKGNEYSDFAKEYKEFINCALSYIIKHSPDDIQTYSHLAFSSKSFGLTGAINKMSVQAKLEADSGKMEIFSRNAYLFQDLKNKLSITSDPQEKAELYKNLCNVLIEDIFHEFIAELQTEESLSANKIPNLISVQNKLKTNEALLEYSFTDEKLNILIVKKEGAYRIEKNLKNWPGTFRKALYNLKSGAEIGKEISEILLNGLQPYLSNIERLIIIPDKELLKLPYEALAWNNNLLLNEFEVAYNYSTGSWYQSRISDKTLSNKNLLSVAPVFENAKSNSVTAQRSYYRGDYNPEYLKYSKDEVNLIDRIFTKENLNHQSLLAEAAKEASVKESMQDYEIIHFATHGVVNKKNTERSGLYMYLQESQADGLNDGFLSLGEIYNMNLKAKLVVLSACETGVGDLREGQGVMALPRGFIYAGVPNVVASLWKVHDERTKDLMSSFYKYLIEDNETYSGALQKAKLDFLKKGYNPLDWAGFILIGE